MSVSMNEELTEFDPNQPEKQRDQTNWDQLDSDSDFDLPPESSEGCNLSGGTCAQSGARGQIQTGQIQPDMDVIASCGNRIGTVDHLDGDDSIKLKKHDSLADGMHHWIPTAWVQRVDEHVHLNLNSQEAMNRWQTEGASCESCAK